jgi:hypothetical protein
MANPAAPNIIIFFTISLLFTSLVTSWILLQAYGVTIAGLPFVIPSNTESITLSDTSQFIGSGWSYVGNQQVSTNTNSYLLAKKTNYLNTLGSYDNSYTINNPNKLDYSIVLSYSPVRTQEVYVTNDGFTVLEHTIGVSDLLGDRTIYFYPYQGANQITNAQISTSFNTGNLISNNGEPVLDFKFSGQDLFQVTQGDNGGFNTQTQTITDVYYGGVGSKNNIGLGVSSFSATGDTSNVSNGVSDLWNFAIVLFKLLGWGIEPQYLPVELNLILIKSQEFAIGIGIVGLFWK